MPWARFEGEFPKHGKVQRIDAAMRPSAIAMQVAAVCYSVEVLSDGFVSEAVAWSLALQIGHVRGARYDASRLAKLTNEMLQSGLWDRAPGGFQIHDYADYQPLADDVKERRKAERDKKRRQRGQLQIETRGSVPPSVPPGQTGAVPEGHDEPVPPVVPGGLAGTRPQARAPDHPHTPTTPAAEDLRAKELEEPAAALAETEPPRESRVADILRTLRGADANSFNQVWPLSQQLDTAAFEEAVAKVSQRRDVDNPVGLLIWLLEQAAGQRVRDQTAEIRTNGSAVFIPAEPPPDLDEFVRTMRRWTLNDFEQAFAQWQLDEDERIRLADLAADLRAVNA